MSQHQRFLAAAIVALWMFTAPVAVAGPPLLCHSIDIGGALSLPFGTNSWKDRSEQVTASEILAATLRILNSDSPVLLRMETLRRATIYAADDATLAGNLLVHLLENVVENGTEGRRAALAQFDLGYLLCTYQQQSSSLPQLARTSGYVWVQKAARALPEESAVQFACALITCYPRQTVFAGHLQAALRGASNDRLLADNLVAHFGQGESYVELCRRYDVEPRAAY